MSRGDKHPWQPVEAGLRLRIRLTPKSSRDEILGLVETAEGPAVAAKVRAVPESGRANAALEKLVAGWLGISPSSVKLASGQKSRIKSLVVEGAQAELATTLAGLLTAPSPE